MAASAGILGPRLDLVGVVTTFTTGEQGGAQVRQFLVQPEEGMPVPVELRGQSISGVLAEGHTVALAVPPDLDTLEDRTQRPTKLKNLTTGGIVTVTQPGLVQAALGAGFFSLKEIVKAVIGGIVPAALVVIGLTQVSEGETGVAPPDEPDATAYIVGYLIYLGICAAGFYLFVYRRWRWKGGPLRIWLLIGPALFGALVALGLWFA
jgi:hypothetical protein